jgi:hypothetical protein
MLALANDDLDVMISTGAAVLGQISVAGRLMQSSVLAT